MKHTTTPSWIRFLAMTFVIAATAQPIASVADEATPADRASTIVGTADDMEDLAWARQRFVLSGLAVPQIDIEFFDDAEGCAGDRGRVVWASTEAFDVLRVCADHDKPDVRRSWRRRTLVHELAHVWERRTADDSTRQAFMELRGLIAWNDRSMTWFDRATEHAAEIITWAIGDPAWRFDALPRGACQDMAFGYELLTGTTAPRVLDEPCVEASL